MSAPTLEKPASLIASDRVEGTPVFRPGGKRVGTIKRLMLDKRHGTVAYAVMSFGGFMGLGHSHYPLPWPTIKYNTQLEGYETGVTAAQLKDAPAFSDGSWSDRNWEKQTHTYYNAPPYW